MNNINDTYLVDGRARIGQQAVGMCKQHLKKFVLKLVCGTHSWPEVRRRYRLHS